MTTPDDLRAVREITRSASWDQAYHGTRSAIVMMLGWPPKMAYTPADDLTPYERAEIARMSAVLREDAGRVLKVVLPSL